MKRLIKKAMENKLIKDNLILFIGTLILNVLGFAFHFYMGRALGPADYGALGVLLAIAYLMLIPMGTIQTGIANFTAKFKTSKEYGKISYLYKRASVRFGIISIASFILFLLISKPLAEFLKISWSSTIVVSFFLIFVFLLSVTRGTLQGLQKFTSLSFNLIIEGFVKFISGVVLVLIGFKVDGAIGSIVLAYFIAYLIGFYPIKKLLKIKGEEFNTKEVYAYTLPVLLMLVSLTMFYSVDIVITKHFFSLVDAGYYSALALLGKIVFFGSMSITQVMFPKLSESFVNKDGKHKKLLFYSLGLISLFALSVILVYFFVPGIVVNILYGEEYITITKMVWIFGLFMGLFSMVYALAFYQISKHKTSFIWILFLFNILEAVLLWMFHSSILQVGWILVSLMAVLFIILLGKTVLEKQNA